MVFCAKYHCCVAAFQFFRYKLTARRADFITTCSLTRMALCAGFVAGLWAGRTRGGASAATGVAHGALLGARLVALCRLIESMACYCLLVSA